MIENLVMRYPLLSVCKESIYEALQLLIDTFSKDHRLYICGNGGSAADSLHIVGELLKEFASKRSLESAFVSNVNDDALLASLNGALPAFALVENTALCTAFMNDCNPEYVYAQQVYAYARAGDCVWGISTSGNSDNIIHAMTAAKGRNALTIGLTGADGGRMKDICDCTICVPEKETYKIQELHLPIYHALCLALEEHFWGQKK